MLDRLKNYLRDPKVAKIATPILVFLFVVWGVFMRSQGVSAWGIFDIVKSPGLLVGWILAMILAVVVGCVGLFVLMFIFLLTLVSGYNNFTNSVAVIKGWTVVRDISNMFFIVVLLVIAFGTILKLENYQWKKLMPKLLVMAVLINFSKLFCGLLIDFSQVVMLTFVNAFKGGGGGSWVSFLGIGDSFSATGSGVGAVLDYDVVAISLALALVRLIISGVVILIFVLILVMRIVMLWILVVLSPLAFLLSVFPMSQEYAKKWWTMFGKYLIVGPVLAFFLWLSLATMNGGTNIVSQQEADKTGEVSANIGASANGDWSKTLSFIVGIAMLIGGLMITQSLGVAGGAMAGKAVEGIRSTGKMAANKGVEMASRATGLELRPQKWAEGFQNWRKASSIKSDSAIASKAMERMATGSRLGRALAYAGAPRDAWEGFMSGRAFGVVKGGESQEARATRDEFVENRRARVKNLNAELAPHDRVGAGKRSAEIEKEEAEYRQEKLESKIREPQIEEMAKEMQKNSTVEQNKKVTEIGGKIKNPAKRAEAVNDYYRQEAENKLEKDIVDRADEKQKAAKGKKEENDLLKEQGLDPVKDIGTAKQFLTDYYRSQARDEVLLGKTESKKKTLEAEQDEVEVRFVAENSSEKQTGGKLIGEKLAEIQQKRREGKEPGYKQEDINKVLKDNNLTAGSPKALEFIKELDNVTAEREVSKQRKSYIADYKKKQTPEKEAALLKEKNIKPEETVKATMFLENYYNNKTNVQLLAEMRGKVRGTSYRDERRSLIEEVKRDKRMAPEKIKEFDSKRDNIAEQIVTIDGEIMKQGNIKVQVEKQEKTRRAIESEQRQHADDPEHWGRRGREVELGSLDDKITKSLANINRGRTENRAVDIDQIAKALAKTLGVNEVRKQDLKKYLRDRKEEGRLMVNISDREIDQYYEKKT